MIQNQVMQPTLGAPPPSSTLQPKRQPALQTRQARNSQSTSYSAAVELSIPQL
jgi:hypothetical protein